jgi:aquaporin Z
MKKNSHEPFPWNLFLAEFAGTALLLLIGLSVVIFLFGTGSPMSEIIPNLKIRQVISGLLFGSTGGLISISALGKVSGSHINPAVTMTFWIYRKLSGRVAIIYVAAQLLGAVTGTLPLLLWGQLGKSIFFGATMPGKGYTVQEALLGEVITTFTYVSFLITFLAFRKLRQYTPALSPILYAIMVPLEADISGTSTNPARSFGPAVISETWISWWIYCIGPITGALLASIVCNMLAKRITVAKLYHFDHDPTKLFQRMGSHEKKVTVK